MFGNGNDAEKRLGKENRNLSQELICKTYGEKEEKISTQSPSINISQALC